MLKKKGTKKRFSFIAVVVMALVLLFAPASAQAATNPLAGMAAKYSGVVNKEVRWKGANYVTPYYNSKVSIKVRSSNPKVATVKGESYSEINWQTGKKGYAACFTVTPVSAGSAKIYVTVTVKGKSYSKSCTYKSYKWESAVSSFKIGSVNYQKQLNRSNVVHTKKKLLSGKVYYKVKPGFKVTVWANYYANSKDKYPTKYKQIKSGQALPKRTCSISIQADRRSNGMKYSTSIEK